MHNDLLKKYIDPIHKRQKNYLQKVEKETQNAITLLMTSFDRALPPQIKQHRYAGNKLETIVDNWALFERLTNCQAQDWM